VRMASLGDEGTSTTTESGELVMARFGRPAQPVWRQFVGPIAFVLVVGLLAAANLAKSVERTEGASSSPDSASRLILLVGDASAGQDGCPGRCRTYTEQLAANLQHEGPEAVKIEDRSWRTNTWPPASVNSVAAYMRADPGLRQAVRSADVLVLALTGTSPNEFAEQLRSLLDEVDWIRHDEPVDLRVVIAPRPTSSGTWVGQVAETGCQVVVSYAGACVNVSELVRSGRLAPADWQPSPGHPRLSQNGHDVLALELVRTSDQKPPRPR
jgi:hypothetical protein